MDWIAIAVIFSFIKYGHGQCDDATKPLVLTASGEAQYLTSANYPSNYDANSDCEWRITASGDRLIVLNVQSLRTESCSYDYLEIYDGFDSSSTRLGKLCSDNMDEVVSSSSDMFFQFTSDSSVQYEGFNILYFVADAQYQYPCDTNPVSVTATPQTMMSHNMPYLYGGNVDCSWTLVASGTNEVVLIKIKFLDLETSASCANDALTFYDGATTGDVQLSSLCSDAGTYEFSDIQSTGSAMLVKFTTDAAQFGYGFLLTYETYIVTTTTTTTTTTTLPFTSINTCSYPAASVTAETWANYITSPNYGSSNYDNDLTCHWLITAPTNYAITFQLDDSSFEIEYNSYCSYDYVEFYDGDSTSATRLNRFCGTSAPSTVYRTAGVYGYIVFSSDYSITKTGFRVSYTAVDNTYPGCKSSYTAYSTTYNLAPGFSGTFSTVSSSGYDGSTKYAENLEEYWLFTNDQTGSYKMVLEFTYMSVESSTGCIYDRVTLYNGPCLKDGIQDTACGTYKKRYDLVGSEFLLHFHTDTRTNRRGFQLEYYALALTSTPPTTTTTTMNGPPVEAVIEAMSELLTNYSNDILPNRDLSTAIGSTVDFYLVGINGIDEVEQKMTSTGQFIVKWTDYSLTWEPTRQSNIKRLLFPQNDLWRPDLALMNGFSQLVQMGADFMYIDVDYTGQCIWKPYQIMDSVCQIDMTNYPYDTQECSLQFGTWASSDSDVETQMGTDGLAIHVDYQENSEWVLLTHKAEVKTINSQKTLKYTLTLKRSPSYVTFYITVPTVMLAFMNAFTFAIPCGSGEKSGFSITIFLSFVVVLIVVKDSMPDTSETVSLYAIYLLILTMLSAIALMLSVTQIRLLSYDQKGRKVGALLGTIVKKINGLQSKLMFCGKDTNDSSDSDVVNITSVDTTEDDKITWADVVASSDFVFFILFFVLTTILTTYLFLRMSLL